ncbi:MAG TPA: hypothetical protein DCM73_13575 [Clostridiales bacterium]|nr:hypothetical protein [Clostridiales bacterium]
MPATYAHYMFGHEVLKLLDDDVQKIINGNIGLYNIGLHGPDILFYYKPLKSNHVNSTGYRLHKITADTFFENARQKINSCPDCDAACAYILGFICHFMLDSQCHPYIRQKEIVATHSTIETEFDRLFMLKNDLNPLTFRPTSHIEPNFHNAEVISWFFDDIAKEEILKALKQMKFYLNFLVSPGRLKRSLITGGLKASGNYDGIIGLMMRYEPVEACVEINEVLYDLFVKAVEPAAGLVSEYYKNIKSGAGISERFGRNFE